MPHSDHRIVYLLAGGQVFCPLTTLPRLKISEIILKGHYNRSLKTDLCHPEANIYATFLVETNTVIIFYRSLTRETFSLTSCYAVHWNLLHNGENLLLRK